jgi:hypothetical protein
MPTREDQHAPARKPVAATTARRGKSARGAAAWLIEVRGYADSEASYATGEDLTLAAKPTIELALHTAVSPEGRGQTLIVSGNFKRKQLGLRD